MFKLPKCQVTSCMIATHYIISEDPKFVIKFPLNILEIKVGYKSNLKRE